jgi:hypothetical protein
VSPGFLYHIRAYGIEWRNIFHDDTDRDEFISRLPHPVSLAPDIGTGAVFLEALKISFTYAVENLSGYGFGK